MIIVGIGVPGIRWLMEKHLDLILGMDLEIQAQRVKTCCFMMEDVISWRM